MKKRSAAKQPEPPTFFIDRSLGRIDVPGVLRAAGYISELHDDHFDPQTEDAVWMNSVAAARWVVLTKDERIRYRPLELQALQDASLRAFIVICGNVRGVETAAILLKAMPMILDTVQNERGPFIYCVYKDSKLRKAKLRGEGGKLDA